MRIPNNLLKVWPLKCEDPKILCVCPAFAFLLAVMLSTWSGLENSTGIIELDGVHTSWAPNYSSGRGTGWAAMTQARALLKPAIGKPPTWPMRISPPARGEGHFKIKYISVIAERHSGSTWMYHFLRKYFARKDLRVVPTLCTWKHWFQDRMHRDIQEGTRICRNTQPCPGCKDANHTLVVAMWRNPYDWITAMSQYPHHAEAHFGLRYNLSAFMTKRWMLEPQKEMKARDEARLKDPVKDPCMDNFLPWEVLPCSPQNRDAIYELDSDGGAYDNIYALRKAKIEDFNAVESWVRLYERVRYEDVLHVEGLKKWLGSLESKYGLVGDETVMPGKTVASQMQTKLSEMFYVNSKHCMPHCEMGSSASGQEAVRTLHTLFDDELEGSVGYTRVPEDRD